MNTLKYILVQVEAIALICSIILGIGAAESAMWGQAILFLFGPFIYGKLVNFEKHVDFWEAYDRAWRIKYIKSN